MAIDRTPSTGRTSTHTTRVGPATTTQKVATPLPAAQTNVPKSADTATAFAGAGTATKDVAAKAVGGGAPVKAGGGVMGFLVREKSAAPKVDVELATSGTAARAGSPSMQALLALRDACPPQYAPLVEVATKDGAVITGFLKGIDDAGRAVIDNGSYGSKTLALDANLSMVKHQMDTTGDLNTALVTVFDAAKTVADPWAPGAGLVGKTFVVETFGAEHASLAVAAKKGDVSGRDHVLKGATKEGLRVDDGTLRQEDWSIAKMQLKQPAYSYKADGHRLRDVGAALANGTAVDVTLPGGRALAGTLLGTAQDATGADYVVIAEKSGVRHALRDVIDVKAQATTIDVWRHPDYAAVYGR